MIDNTTSVQRACNWILHNMLPCGGVRVTSAMDKPYPEVTGYIVPTMIMYGFRREALAMCDWLAKVQQPNGAFLGPNGREYLFDTAQVLRGFLSASKITDKYNPNMEKAAECLFGDLEANTCFRPQWEGDPANVPEPTMLFALAPMLEYAQKKGNDKYIRLVNNCAKAYLQKSDALSISTLTHYLAYQIDGLIDIGFKSEVEDIVAQLLKKQTPEGFIPAYDGVAWTCIPGLAQIAIILYKLDMRKPADRLMEYLDAHQENSGGFPGSLGAGAAYFPKEEPSWAVKFYMDAYKLRIKSFFNEEFAKEAPAGIGAKDGRVMAISLEINGGDNILEVGCGKGRILNKLMESFPACSFTGLDLSPAMLDFLPDGAEKIEGWAEDIPCNDNSFDVVYAVESLEHSTNLRGAVEEMVRIAKPDGRIIIIDKQLSQWGRYQCPPWETWPERDYLENVLKQFCSEVYSEPVRYDNSGPDDELMIKWIGRKN